MRIKRANERVFRPAGGQWHRTWGVGRENSSQWPVDLKLGAGCDGKAPDRSRPNPKGNGARQPAVESPRQGESRLQLSGVTGNHSSGLCLSGRERISIVLLSFGGASWVASGSVRGGVNARHPARGRLLPRQVRSRQGRCLALHGPSRVEDIRTTAQGVRTVDEDWRLAHSCRYPGLDRFDRAEHAECGRA